MRKGHKQYLTIISDISISHHVKILAVIKGRKNEDIFPFLNSIPRDKQFSFESITIDMSASYFPALKKIINDDNTFNRLVTIDRFHVAKLLETKWIKRERKS